MRGNKTLTSKIDTAIATNPAGKLYIKVDRLPVTKQPNIVRNTTNINASNHPKTSKVKSPKMLLSPIFAPGKNRGGKRFSIANVTNAIAVNTPKYAIFFASNFLIFTPHWVDSRQRQRHTQSDCAECK